jgi:hypothetical protein
MKRVLRNSGRTALGLGIVGVTVAMAAAPAYAASGSLTVSPNGTVSSATKISISGHYDNRTSMGSVALKLTIDRPGGGTYTLWSGSGGGLSAGNTPTQSFDTQNAPWSSQPAANGTYTVNFSVGSSTASPVSVTLRVPAAAVTNFAGTASGTVAHFSWSADTEPDIAGYDIVDVTDGSRRDLTPGGIDNSVCSQGSCGVDVDFGSSASGTSRNFVVDALRWTSPAQSNTIASQDAPASVTFPAASTPTPDGASGGANGGSVGGGVTGGSGGSTGGGTSSGTTTSGGRVSGSSKGPGAINSGHASAALRAYLPASSAGAAPDLPSVVTEVKPLPEGTYKPTLAYPDQIQSQAVQHRANGPIATVGTDLVHVLNVQELWKSLAAAAIVLLIAAHLRAWLRAADALDR